MDDILLQVDFILFQRKCCIIKYFSVFKFQISKKKNCPGDIKEEIQKFLEFAEDKVIKHQAFKLFDVNGDGVVTFAELKNVLKKLGGNVSDKDIGDMIGSADDDGNEEVDYREFEKLWELIRGDSEVSLNSTKTFQPNEKDDISHSG